MYIITRLIPAIIGCSLAVGIEYALHIPARFIIVMGVVLLVELLLALVVVRRNSVLDRMTLLAPPAIFFLGASFGLFFVSPAWLQHVITALVVVGSWLYFEEVYRYTYVPETYHQHAIEHLASFLGITAMALNMLGVFALRIFLDVRLIYLLPLSLIIATLVSTSVLAVQPLSRKLLWSSVVVFAILIMEMTWAVHFLPSSYLVDSCIVTIPFYVALNLVRHELSGTLTRPLIKRFAWSGAAALLIVLVTAQWII